VVSLVQVPTHFCGWSSMVHGGIIATMLDEIMGWTAIHFLNRLPLTKSMTVRYHKSVSVQSLLRLTGEVEERLDERQARMKAKLHDGEGALCAESLGEFSLFTLEAAQKRGFTDDAIIRELRPFLKGAVGQ
jgi:acyl-coenzyme A thioesterase PaaI-like protein